MATTSQKVIIPRGLVNPRETTIIEIPKSLQNRPTVVAKPKSSRGHINQNVYQASDFHKKQELAETIKATLAGRMPVQKNHKYEEKQPQRQNVSEYGDNNLETYQTDTNWNMCNYLYEMGMRNGSSLYETGQAKIANDGINTLYVNPNQSKDLNRRCSNALNHDSPMKKNELYSISVALDEMENVELNQIQKDLKDFQEARRKLILHATNLHK